MREGGVGCGALARSVSQSMAHPAESSESTRGRSSDQLMIWVWNCDTTDHTSAKAWVATGVGSC